MPRTGLACATACLLAFASAAMPMGASAQEPFFKGKEINLVIGVLPGGGYDLYARLLGRHWGKHIPGNPTVVPRNMDGAGSKVAGVHLFSIAPKDGTTVGAVENGLPFEPLFSEGKHQFDPVKFGWVGNLNKEVNMLVFWHTAGANSIKDVQQREFVVAASAGAGSSNTMPKILNELIGTKIKVVTGYKTSADGFLAMERGEVHGRGLYYSTMLAGQRDNYEAGRLKILLQLALEKHPKLPDVPFVLDLAKTPEDRKLMELLFASLTIGRPVLAPPGLAAERLKILRDSFDAAMADSELLAEAEKRKMEIVPMKGADVEKIINQVYAAPPELVARAKKMEIH